MNFDSGWEWGYWLSDVVTARASWDPLLPFVTPSTDTIVKGGTNKDNGDSSGGDGDGDGDGHSGTADEIGGSEDHTVGSESTNNNKPTLPVDYQAQQDQWIAFATAITPYTKIYGPVFGEWLNKILVELAQQQAQLLVHGRVNGEKSPDLRKLGMLCYVMLYCMMLNLFVLCTRNNW